MNKRTFSNNENSKSKTGVKRYLMSNDESYENQKNYHEKQFSSKLSNSSVDEINRNDYNMHNNKKNSCDSNSTNSNNKSNNNNNMKHTEYNDNNDISSINDKRNDSYNNYNNSTDEYTHHDNHHVNHHNKNSDSSNISYSSNSSDNGNNMKDTNRKHTKRKDSYNNNNSKNNNSEKKNDENNNEQNNNKSNNDDSNNNNDNNENSNSNIYYSNDSKKRKGSIYSIQYFKKEKNNVTNTCLILKNVPKEAHEEDIKSFIRPFLRNVTPDITFYNEGIVVNLYDNELNENIYNYFNEYPTQIKGSFINVKLANVNDCHYMNEEVLDMHRKGSNDITNNNNNNNNNKDGGNNNDNNYNHKNNDNNMKEALITQDKRHVKNKPKEFSKVILVSVVNVQFPVDMELIYYIFSKCGTVEKIITLSRSLVVYQALVQLNSIDAAKEAIKTLHNRNIYDGCNTIYIEYSFLKELTVKANNSTSWDYTISSAPVNKNIPVLQNMQGVLPMPKKSKEIELFQMMEQKFKSVNFETKNTSKTPVLICYNIPKDYTDVKKIFNLFSIYGYVSKIKILREKPDSALIQYTNYLFSSLAQECLQHAKICDQVIEVHFSKILDIRISMQQKKAESFKAKTFSNYDQRYLVSTENGCIFIKAKK
uniref:RRM domain-containing protein n=1 Tax=Piliocolobus tephrosceles TaxID=591936 RepID=A0A8C9IX72_9PRIM